MKRIVLLTLALLFILFACSSNKSNDLPFDEVGVGYYSDDGETGDMQYPYTYTDSLGNEITFYAAIDSFLCWDYTVLNSVLVATNDASFVAGFNKEDIVGTLIYKLFPELENVPSIIENGQIDISAVESSGAEYIFLTDESTIKYADIFKREGIQTIFTCHGVGEGISIGHNTINDSCIAVNYMQRLNSSIETYWAMIPSDLSSNLKQVSFSERRSVLFLGDSMESVYTALCAQQMMDACMAKNVAENLEITDGYMTDDGTMAARYTSVTVQQIQEWNPDVIWVPYYADYTAEDVLNNPDFQDITAVKNGEVYTVPGTLEPWYYPTLSICLGTTWAVYTLYPEICSYDRVVEEAKSYYSDIFGAEFSEEEMGLHRIN